MTTDPEGIIILFVFSQGIEELDTAYMECLLLKGKNNNVERALQQQETFPNVPHPLELQSSFILYRQRTLAITSDAFPTVSKR